MIDKLPKIAFSKICILIYLQITLISAPCFARLAQAQGQDSPTSGAISSEFAMSMVDKVNALIKERFFNQSLAKQIWTPQYADLKEKAAKCKTLSELTTLINNALAKLKVSHTVFASEEQEIFYFLHSLFGTMQRDDYFSKGGADGEDGEIFDFLGGMPEDKRKEATAALKAPQPRSKHMCVPGFVTGGTDFAPDVVRYVLVGSPADQAGLQIGDRIITANGKAFSCYKDLLVEKKGKLTLKICRGAKTKTEKPAEQIIEFTPSWSELYPAYVRSIEDSYKIIKVKNKSLAYIRFIVGGPMASDVLQVLLSRASNKSDGLILDLRDGYGAANYTDLDYFFRPASAYPVTSTVDFKGQTHMQRLYYNKPVVALINRGTRSGKELMSYGLKKSKRATLIGDRTAGYVLAGQFIPINERCGLFLAVADVKLGKISLEGGGVEPDILIKNESGDKAGEIKQLNAAIKVLERQLAGK